VPLRLRPDQPEQAAVMRRRRDLAVALVEVLAVLLGQCRDGWL